MAVFDLTTKKSEYASKLFRTGVLFASFLAFVRMDDSLSSIDLPCICLVITFQGVSRSLQGPTMLELQKQINADTNTFQIIFILGLITFPFGNVLGGVLIEKMSPCLLLSISMVILSISNFVIPFSSNIGTLASGSAFAELAFGFIDTGGNVFCLRMWNEKSGPYLNALYLSQGMGFMLAPILAESILPDSVPTDVTKDQNQTNGEDHIAKIPLSDHTIEFQDFDMFTPLQALYMGIGSVSMVIGIGFMFGIPADTKVGSYNLPQDAETGSNVNQSHTRLLQILLIITMTIFSMLANGMSFTYGYFLTAYVVKGSYQLSPQSGARLTSIYYGSLVLMRGVNIPLVAKFQSFHILLFDLASVFIGSICVATLSTFWGLQIGTVLIGLGVGSLFPMGLVWMRSKMELSGKVTALLCVATTLGAQLLRIPEGAFIDTVPMVHVFLLLATFGAIVMTFASAVLLASRKLQMERTIVVTPEKT
ncbi:sodium-dependent glucose transporter 1B-like isoform X1 [Tigriopus californicus]|uniref:sodium-dependent glucose transporter 1B-like isoform X1 n=1 Tax=Tigriopus californicus TaxID=6832 RepID=UPI0027DA2435|nr:sodium-dependent glucose transporter 1B-like isoform X1 [Tigriopus californicus]